jgi:succinyl-CoA synthetase alpha subunit
MDKTLFSESVPVLIQGITGRAGRIHADLMQRYGTNIVGGVSSRSAGEPVVGVPVFTDCAEAVRETGARASLLMVQPLDVLDAVETALKAGVELLVCVAEGVPVHDALKIVRLVREHKAVCVGPSTPGIAIPGRMKIGFLPDVTLSPGPLGVMSKSGTLSYEVCYRLSQQGVGQSLWVGVGGDAVKGVRFADLVPLFEANDQTSAVLVIGEIGGTEEEELADAIRHHEFSKPVYALLAGTSAPEGITMGHAGAMIYGAQGTADSKIAALESVGVHVFTTMLDLVDHVTRTFTKG